MDTINTIKKLVKKTPYLSLLEIGPGENPITNQLDQETIEILDYQAIDREIQSNQLNIRKKEFLNFESEKKFDIIVDRLCWHEQSTKDRLVYLKNTQHALKPSGHFVCEHAVYHKNMDFLQDDLLYDETSYQLLRQRDTIIEVVKFIPPAQFIEKELIDHDFILKKFICSPSKKVICNRNSPAKPLMTDPDHLFFIAQKSFGPRHHFR